MTLRVDGATEAAQALGQFARDLKREAERATEDAGRTIAREARSETEREDLVGATRRFLAGWTTEPRHTSYARTEVYNTAPHDYFAQRGRRPGRMPPAEPIAAWMRAKGIPDEALWPIRVRIAEFGTIKRYGANPGPAGPDLLHSVSKRLEPRVFREMLTAYDRAFARLYGNA